MKIAIIGPGAMGRLLAWFLARGGHQPLLICRRAEQVEAFLRAGLQVVDAQGETHVLPVEAALGLAQRSDIDAALITVKSYDTQAAGEMLHAVREVPLLSLQNGLGNAETLAEWLPAKRLAVGLTTHGAMAEGDTKVLHKGQGRTIIGNWVAAEAGGDAAHWWAELLNGCGHPVQVSSDIRTEVWRKAMVNIGINPFTALWGVRNGELLARADLLPLSERAVTEGEAVAAAEGIVLLNSMERVLDVCRQTAQNQSSMLQDRLRKRRTEIEALSGVIVQLGQRHGVATPVNQLLLAALRDPQGDQKADAWREALLALL